MKDCLGNEVGVGDVLLEFGTGSMRSPEGTSYMLKLWEMPENFDGQGYMYSIDGTRQTFRWVYPVNSIKVDMSLMPDGFEFSFRHGMSDLSTKIKSGTLQELIDGSNWKIREITKEQVERFKHIKAIKIETFDDIQRNIKELRESEYTPRETMSNVLRIVGVGGTPVRNGNIGIASLYDQAAYRAIIEKINEGHNQPERQEQQKE